jgi:hypothetical protein
MSSSRRSSAQVVSQMSSSPPVERLSDREYVVLLIRALVDGDNQLLSGEVGGPDEFGGRERWVRFREPSGLAAAVQTWLLEQKSAGGGRA